MKLKMNVKKTIELRSLLNKLDKKQKEDAIVVAEFLITATKEESKRFGLLLADPDKSGLKAFVESLKLKQHALRPLLQEVV